MINKARSSRRRASRPEAAAYERAPVSGRFAIAIALAYVLLLAFTGGSSRPDALQLVVLRPLTILTGMALLLMPCVEWRSMRPLFILLGLFAATMTLQLIPLPPFLWHAIPGHERYNAVLDAIGASSNWRPITVSVDGTLNALAALTVPFVTLLVLTRLSAGLRPKALEITLLLGAVSMVLGVAQMASSATSSLYFYEVDANDQLVGLLANRNHQGAMLAMMLPLLRVWALMPNARLVTGRTRGAAALAAGAAIIAFILVLGSRAGIVLAAVGVICAFLVRPRFGNPRHWGRQQWLAALGVISALTAVFAVVVLADRAATTDRLAMMQGLEKEGRVEVLPVLLRIAADVWPFGTGYGTFVPVFASYEPDELLTPYYWNNAHNDPLEVLITAGVPGVLVMLAFLAWWVRASYRTLAGGTKSTASLLARGSACAMLILMLASLVDYPLRTPLVGGVFVVLGYFLAAGTARREEKP